MTDTTTPAPDDLAAAVSAALASAHIYGWDVRHAVYGDTRWTDLWHEDAEVMLTVRNGDARYNDWSSLDHERIVALVRAVLAGGVARRCAVELGLPMTTDVLLVECERRGLHWSANNQEKMNGQTTVTLWRLDPADYVLRSADTPAEALAKAVLAAVEGDDRGE